MKKLAVVGTFVAGAAVGFVGGGALAVRGITTALKSEKLRKTVANALSEVIYDCFISAEQIKRDVRYIPHSKRGNTSECLFETREAAESVLNEMKELVTEYGFVRLQDFYELCEIGIESPSFKHIGWHNIDGAKVVFTGRGYEIIIPEMAEVVLDA